MHTNEREAKRANLRLVRTGQPRELPASVGLATLWPMAEAVAEASGREVSIVLDEDIVAALDLSESNLSQQVNAALRAALEQRRHQRLLGQFLEELEAEHGPVDEALVEKYTRLFA